jgi:hypothetical protein
MASLGAHWGKVQDQERPLACKLAQLRGQRIARAAREVGDVTQPDPRVMRPKTEQSWNATRREHLPRVAPLGGGRERRMFCFHPFLHNFSQEGQEAIESACSSPKRRCKVGGVAVMIHRYYLALSFSPSLSLSFFLCDQ